MWDKSRYMADINNFAEITENFDTIKTLLNSIRAQGILNTSDVDKILAGINSKLEKLNTEEDIDLIKIFLSELKQNLDERHSVLISKFGAIESLFSNLLKNSSDMLKSSEVKELFDIVATNLSVFSREVVSQKETLTDITLRLDAMRSDETQKKDIIKSIVPLKNDLERLNNGFDSIVLSLNENFKSLVKTLSSVDQSEAINKFGTELSDILNSSNTILSAIQMIDKKNLQIEDYLRTLATQDDISGAKRAISELTAKNQELANSVDVLGEKYYKIDNLAEKIDASVSIIAGLKSLLEDNGEQHTRMLLDELAKLGAQVREISTDTGFEEFKSGLQSVLKEIFDSTVSLKDELVNSSTELQKINSNIQALDINAGFQNLLTNLHKTELDLKSHTDVASDKVSQLVDVGVTRTINEISSSADALSSRIKETNSALTNMCEKSFYEVVESISGLKNVVSQIDENNVSANNAIFSNITDRLAIFENSLKSSLEKQEDYVANSSSKLFEEITNIKNLSGVLDYKLDSSVIEVNNAKREFGELKNSVEAVLALDFVNIVKDLRVDLYASKQELASAIETSTSDVSDKLSNDLFGKYELLISKLDSVEDGMKQVQTSALTGLKSILDNISSSIVDILSYVSVRTDSGSGALDVKLADITEAVKESNLSYVENVRDIVEVVRAQVEANLIQLEKDTSKQIDTINSSITKNTEALRDEIKYSYNKLLEVQDSFNEVKEVMNSSNASLSSNLETILSNADSLKLDFDMKLTSLKNALLDSVTEFKQEFTCENADKISELKFVSENLHAKSVQNAEDMKREIKQELTKTLDDLRLNVDSSLELVRTNLCDVAQGMDTKVNAVTEGFGSLETAVNKLSTTTTSSLSSTLAQVLDNFVAMKALLNSLNEQSASYLDKSVDKIIQDFEGLRAIVLQVDSNIDRDLTMQLSIIEKEFESIATRIAELLEENNVSFGKRIDAGLSIISERVQNSLAGKLEEYKTQVEQLFEGVLGSTESQSEFIKENVTALSTALQNVTAKQNSDIDSRLKAIAANLKSVLDGNIEITKADYDSLRQQFAELAKNLEEENQNFGLDLRAQFDDIAKFIDSGLEIQAQEVNAKFGEISTEFQRVSGVVSILNNDVRDKIDNLRASVEDINSQVYESVNSSSALIANRLKELLDELTAKNDEVSSNFLTGLSGTNDCLSQLIMSQSSALAENFDKKNDIIGQKQIELAKDFDTKASSIISSVKNISPQITSLQQDVNTQFISQTDVITDLLEDRAASISKKQDALAQSIDSKSSGILNAVENISPQLSNLNNVLSQNLETKAVEIMSAAASSAADVITGAKAILDANSEDLNAGLSEKFAEVKNLIEESASLHQNSISIQAKNILDEITTIHGGITRQLDEINSFVSLNLSHDINSLYEKIQKLLEEHSLNFVTGMGNTSTRLIEELRAQSSELKELFESLNNRLDKDEVSQMNLLQSQLKEVSLTFNTLIEESKNVTKAEVSSITETLIGNSKVLMDDVEQSIEDKVNSILAACADISAGELQSMEAFADKILHQIEAAKQNSNACRDVITDLVNKNLDLISDNIEKETDVIVKDLIEQFELLRESQKDELSKMSVHVESSIEDYIYNYVNDLKSYMDVKTDSSIMNHKLDSLKSELDDSIGDVISNINKMLEASVFTSTMSDIKTANEILLTSMSEKLNKQIQDFVKENVTTKLEDRINLFDKKFVDTVVDKYEEIKLISSQYNNAFEEIQKGVNALVSGFIESKDEISSSLNSLVGGIQNSIDELQSGFADLKAQIMNKSFDEAFHASVNSQISGIEELVKEQLGYIEDISELCCNNLPELTEMNTIVKYGIQQSIADLTEKIDNQDVVIEKELTGLKSDIITQFLNVFNQISFVAEQEEILDFIQEKHSDLITILSHIVTTVEGVSAVDNKVSELKNDIENINAKISSIISSQGDIDYVYSLQDLESDIANLRMVLNDIKEENKSKDFEELVNSTNDIYKLVETIKAELPRFEADEFKREFDSLAEDIVSISTRTNKLILASDESYKTLQDNLQDFKLVINDLDERTRNFAEDAGITRIDDKLGSINSMIQQGAKTNQVFNQVFEYLAEWVDKAGEQITTISDKVETLDDIGQIKVMLEDLKAEAEDNTDSIELIEALGNVFDKQAKRISSLEAKLDRIIVETTISNKNNKVDLTPMEDTLNRFLAAIDDKMADQQSKINSLEAKLEEVMTKIDPKDTAQLTKKVGGMDRQIAKLNKSIEKIASHVVEK